MSDHLLPMWDIMCCTSITFFTCQKFSGTSWNTSQTPSRRCSRKWRFFVTHTQTHLHLIIISITIIIIRLITCLVTGVHCCLGTLKHSSRSTWRGTFLHSSRATCNQGVVHRFLINEDEDGDAVGDGGDHLVALLPGHLPWNVVALLPLFLTADLDTIVVFNLFEVSVDFKIPTCFGTCFACCSHTWEDIKFGKLEN